MQALNNEQHRVTSNRKLHYLKLHGHHYSLFTLHPTLYHKPPVALLLFEPGVKFIQPVKRILVVKVKTKLIDQHKSALLPVQHNHPAILQPLLLRHQGPDSVLDDPVIVILDLRPENPLFYLRQVMEERRILPLKIRKPDLKRVLVSCRLFRSVSFRHNEMFKNGGDPAQIVKEKNLVQVSDTAFIQEAIEKILGDNPREVAQFLAGKETIIQWLMGQVARATRGKADPNVAKELLVKALEARRK